jgi:hypothetical protein
MQQITVLAIATLALLGSLAPGQASTKLLWRTSSQGTTIVTNSLGKPVLLNSVDVSGYDRFRVVVTTRRPAGLATSAGYGSPFQVELHIGEGSDDLGLLENGLLALNPTATTVAAHQERASIVYDFPVITTLLVEVVGPTASGPQTTADIYVYGETASTASSP